LAATLQLGIEPSLGNNTSVSEKDTGGYVEASWDTEVAGMPPCVGMLASATAARQIETARGYTFPERQSSGRGFLP